MCIVWLSSENSNKWYEKEKQEDDGPLWVPKFMSRLLGTQKDTNLQLLVPNLLKTGQVAEAGQH